MKIDKTSDSAQVINWATIKTLAFLAIRRPVLFIYDCPIQRTQTGKPNKFLVLQDHCQIFLYLFVFPALIQRSDINTLRIGYIRITKQRS